MKLLFGLDNTRVPGPVFARGFDPPLTNPASVSVPDANAEDRIAAAQDQIASGRAVPKLERSVVDRDAVRPAEAAVVHGSQNSAIDDGPAAIGVVGVRQC